MKRSSFACGLLLGFCALGADAAPKLAISGSIITSYADIWANEVYNRDTDGLKFQQADLGLHLRLSDDITGFARLATGGTSFSITEAHMRFGGLPWGASVTAGRFYKPLGAPIPLANLSFTQLMFHSSSEIGIKVNLPRDWWNVEAGVVNGTPLVSADNSVRVAGTPVLSNVSISGLDNNNGKDIYSRLGIEFGEDWGALTGGVTYTLGRLGNDELIFLRGPLGNPGSLRIFQSTRDSSKRRQHVGVDLDYQRGPFRIFGEYINARDGRLRRSAHSVAGSYSLYPRIGNLIATVGYDRLRVNEDRTILSLPHTWDRDRTSFSLALWPFDFLQLQAEFDLNRESARQSNNRKIPNDAFIFQTILYF